MKQEEEEKKIIIFDSLYYYGVEIKSFKNLPYEEVLYKKILCAKTLMKKLVFEENMQDHHRMNKVKKAIDFNTNLLLELGYSMADISRKINLLQKEERNV